MAEKLIMSISIISAAVLFIVGLVKLPFGKFKEKHPKWYKATFFVLSLVLVVVGSILFELYFLELPLLSWQFAALIIGSIAGVLVSYEGYEKTGLKALANKVFTPLKDLLNRYSDTSIAKTIKEVGMEKIKQIAASITTKVEEISEAKEQVVTDLSEAGQYNNTDSSLAENQTTE